MESLTLISFTFHDNECTGNFQLSEKGKGWYKVLFLDHAVVILPVGIKTKEGKTVWVQYVQPNQTVWPHELIQQFGEAIESSNNK